MKFFLILCSCSLAILCADTQTLMLGDLGSVRYLSNAGHLMQIQRLSPTEEMMYTHSYYYDENGKLLSESLMNESGEIVYENDLGYIEETRLCEQIHERPYTEYDCSGNLIRLKNKEFAYDDQNCLIQVTTPNAVIGYIYDSSGKRISRTINGYTEYYI